MALFNVSNGRAQFDAAGNEPGDVYGAGVRLTQAGATRVTTTAGTDFNGGIPMSSTGQVSVVDATAGLPAGTIYLNGLPISNNAVCVSRNAAAVVSNGLPFDSAGAVAGDINLDLNFVGATSLNSSVTFTRASTGTFFNSAGVLTSAATNAPRFDFNPSTLAAQGLLIEESRTNSIRNNTMVGAVAGTPGTLPTNWSESLGGVTRQVVGTGTTNGITWIDIRLSGTASGSPVTISFEQVSNTAAAAGQSWNGSFWIALVGGTTTNVTGVNTRLRSYATGPSFLGQADGSAITLTSNLVRYDATYSSLPATTAFIEPVLRIGVNTGVAIDITLRIGLPQLELGAFATSVIPTTTTALTRAADVASVNTLSPWYNASAGTLFSEFVIPFDSSTSIFPAVAYVSDGTFNNAVVLYERTVDDTRRGNIRVGGVQQFDQPNGGTYVYDTVAKTAIAFQTNDVAFSANGTSPTTSASTTIPTVNVLGLGSNNSLGGSLSPLNGYLRRITYYPRRLSNAELQAITT